MLRIFILLISNLIFANILIIKILVSGWNVLLCYQISRQREFAVLLDICEEIRWLLGWLRICQRTLRVLYRLGIAKWVRLRRHYWPCSPSTQFLRFIMNWLFIYIAKIIIVIRYLFIILTFFLRKSLRSKLRSHFCISRWTFWVFRRLLAQTRPCCFHSLWLSREKLSLDHLFYIFLWRFLCSRGLATSNP